MAKRAQIKKELDMLTLPSAENAKWLGIGFLTSVLLFILFFLTIFHIGQQG